MDSNNTVNTKLNDLLLWADQQLRTPKGIYNVIKKAKSIKQENGKGQTYISTSVKCLLDHSLRVFQMAEMSDYVLLREMAELYFQIEEYDTMQIVLFYLIESITYREGEFSFESEEALTLFKLLFYYIGEAQFDEAENFYYQCLNASGDISQDDDPSQFQCLFARLCATCGRIDQAKIYYNNAIKLVLSSKEDGLVKSGLVAWIENDMHNNCKINVSLKQNFEEELKKSEGLFNQAQEMIKNGDPSKAEELLNDCLEKLYETAGYSLAYATTLANLGNIYKSSGKLSEAESAYQKAIEVCKEPEQGDKCASAVIMGKLASLYEQTGRYQEAINLYQNSLSILKDTGMEDSTYYGINLGELSYTYSKIERFEDMESSLISSLDILENSVGINSKEYAKNLNIYASICSMLSRTDEAVRYYEKTLAIMKQLKETKTSDYAITSYNLAMIYNQIGNFEKSEPILNNCIGLMKMLNMTNTGIYIDAKKQLTLIYRAKGDVLKARFHEEKADIQFYHHYGFKSREAALQSIQYGMDCLKKKKNIRAHFFFETSIDILNETISKSSLSLAQAYYGLAISLFRRGKTKKSIENSISAVRTCNNNFKIMKIESSKESYLSIFYKIKFIYDLLLSLLSICSFDRDIVLFSLSELIQRKSGELHLSRWREYLIEEYSNKEELKNIKKLIADIEQMQKSISMDKEERISEENDNIEKLKQKYYILEDKILDRAKKMRVDVKLKNEALDYHQKHEIIIDFCAFENQLKDTREISYAAILYIPDNPIRGDIIYLGKSKDIDMTVDQLRKELINKSKNITDVKRKLFSLLYEPLVEKVSELKSASRITICADGELTKLPFELIIPDKQIRYLTSSTDGEWIGLSRTRNDDDTVSGSPVCGHAPKKEDGDSYNIGAVFPMDELKYSWLECSKIVERLKNRNKGKITYLAEADFNKKNVMSIKRPRIWHISTHGFFYENEEREDLLQSKLLYPFEQQMIRMQDPYRRCGLAVFRANRAIEGLKIAEKVLVTGRDILGLDLTGTDLVVLSACNTGLGDVHNGDGVWGLQRAFMLSGVKTLVMSLWNVDDLTTSILMDKMYEGILEGKRIDESLSAAKRYVEESTRDEFEKDGWNVETYNSGDRPYEAPYYWAGFVCLGDGGKMNIG